MSNRLDVMISSTARDLPEHRQAALDACMGLGQPILREAPPTGKSNNTLPTRDTR